MTCEPVREWLFDADDPARTDSSPAINTHLQSCATCRDLQGDLIKLERSWRGQPLPARAESSKAVFLQRLSQPPQPARPRPIWKRAASWTVAASLFAILGASALLFWPADQVEASPDVVDELIDWNLELTAAPSATERKRIFHDRHESLRRAMRQVKLNQHESELAESLLANGVWMVDHEDPIEELGRFHLVADRLLERVNHAGADPGKLERFARQFAKVNARGIDDNWKRLKPEKFADPENKVKFNKMLRDDADRAKKLVAIVDEAPDMTKRELRQALELTNKRPKIKK